jgi:uncharacterized protein (TIGR03086 family)
MTTENLEKAFAATRSIVANVKPDQLDNPTPCASWDVRALLNHIIGGSYWFAASMEAGKSPEGDTGDVTAGDFVSTYDGGIKLAVDAFSEPGAMEKMVTLPFGTMPGAAFIGIATTDILMHGWDLARATGQDSNLDPALASEVLAGARQFIQPAFRGEDTKMPFGAEQSAPAGATPCDELAAFLGRQV